MRVVFLEDVPNVAEAGDVRDVKNGYGRNYLFPRNLAVLATPDQLRRVDSLKKSAAQRQEGSEARAQELSEVLEGLTITISARSGPTGRLYGSVSAATVAEEVSKAIGHDIAGREIALQEPIKAVGAYQTSVRLSSEIAPAITVDVVEEVVEEKTPPRKRKAKAQPAKTKARAKKEAVPTEPEAETAAAVAEVAGEEPEAEAVAEVVETVTEEDAPVEEGATMVEAEAVAEVVETVTEEDAPVEEEATMVEAEAVAEVVETVTEEDAPIEERATMVEAEAVAEVMETVTEEDAPVEEGATMVEAEAVAEVMETVTEEETPVEEGATMVEAELPLKRPRLWKPLPRKPPRWRNQLRKPLRRKRGSRAPEPGWPKLKLHQSRKKSTRRA